MKRPKKRKKIDKGNGMSIVSGDMKEILKRVKDKEPELTEIVERGTKGQDDTQTDHRPVNRT
ncbi:MAG: hypothetical protein HQK96_20615 [Nitrospirae bacterium]|nr:hypothetical protein [Nitrospirota bacterium]